MGVKLHAIITGNGSALILGHPECYFHVSSFNTSGIYKAKLAICINLLYDVLAICKVVTTPSGLYLKSSEFPGNFFI